MKRGFTLIELIVVIIIVGILAAVGINQYSKTVEKSRQSEAQIVFGLIRKLTMGYRLENGTTFGMPEAEANIGSGPNQIPRYDGCRSTHYFGYYFYSAYPDPTIIVWACRCATGGKTPQGSQPRGQVNQDIRFELNAETGSFTWFVGNSGIS